MKTLGFSTETGRIVIRKDSIDAVLYSDTGAYPQWCTLLVNGARVRVECNPDLVCRMLDSQAAESND